MYATLSELKKITFNKPTLKYSLRAFGFSQTRGNEVQDYRMLQ